MKSPVSTLALALAALAVAVAGTGTAVAVAATQVNLVDATSGRAAKVDAQGRLAVAPALSTIASNGIIAGFNSQDNFVTSPTTATLALTRLMLSEPAYSISAANNEVRVGLYKTAASGGVCQSSGYVLLATYHLSPGDDLFETFGNGLSVGPTAGAPYCLDLFVYGLGGTPGFTYFPTYALDAYVVRGNYTGTGAGAAPSASAATPAPAGSGDTPPSP